MKDAVQFDIPENATLNPEKNLATENAPAETSENMQKKQSLTSSLSGQSSASGNVLNLASCKNSDKVSEDSVKPDINLYSKCSERLSEVQHSAVDMLESEICILKNQQTLDNKQIILQQVYPDLKNCKQMNNIECSQILVKTYLEEYKMKTAIDANKSYEEFIKVCCYS